MAEYKKSFWDNMLHCPSFGVVNSMQFFIQELSSKTKLTVVMEFIVCHVLAGRPESGPWWSVNLKKIMQSPATFVKSFKKLCEVSYMQATLQ